MSTAKTIAAALAVLLGACSTNPPEEHAMTTAPYGTWASPLSAAQVAAGATRLEEVELDGHEVYWIEGRPEEDGRYVVVRRSADGRLEDVTPQGFNARSRVHQYGGGAYAVRDGAVYFSNFGDNRLYRQDRGAAPRALTVSDRKYFADCIVDTTRDQLICVREDHSRSDRGAVNTIVAVPIDGGGDGAVLAAGADFYSNPRLSPSGKQISWLQWNHPNMPWDGTELWVASIAPDGTLSKKQRVAGGARESIFEPQWSPGGFASGDRNVHAFYYAPRNHAARAPDEEKPPLIVISHGGPTASATDSLNPKIQYWTTRGFAVVDVNYGGSTGFGRAYRDALKGQWGVVDVDDCIAAAQYLVAQGKADPQRLIVRGGSAGGYTTLAALAFHDVFKAGASHYGVSDIEALAIDTHKFESRYMDQLVGPYPAKRDVYRSRSPIHSANRIKAPLILFQGLDDKVVPPSQSQKMADALRANGVPVAYLVFEGEQHGFRKAENIVRSLEAELAFYGAVFGFKPAGELPELHIDNLKSGT